MSQRCNAKSKRNSDVVGTVSPGTLMSFTETTAVALTRRAANSVSAAGGTDRLNVRTIRFCPRLRQAHSRKLKTTLKPSMTCLIGVILRKDRRRTALGPAARSVAAANQILGVLGYDGTGRTENTSTSGSPLRAIPWTSLIW